MSEFSSVKEYIQYTKIDKQGIWGTEMELLVLSHLLKTSIYTYLTCSVAGLHPQIQELAKNTNMCDLYFIFNFPPFYLYKSCHINLCITFHVYINWCLDLLTFSLNLFTNNFNIAILLGRVLTLVAAIGNIYSWVLHDMTTDKKWFVYSPSKLYKN